MQTLGRVLVSQLRPQMLQGSPAVTAAAVAAAVGHQSLFGSIRWFSSEGESTEGLQRLYIGNISFDTSPADIEQAFQKFGKVHVSGVGWTMRYTCHAAGITAYSSVAWFSTETDKED